MRIAFGGLWLDVSRRRLLFPLRLALPPVSYACAQLWSFLAYDLVLIGPFLGHFANVKPEQRMSLILYTTVLIYSGAVAVYYLLIDRKHEPG